MPGRDTRLGGTATGPSCGHGSRRARHRAGPEVAQPVPSSVVWIKSITCLKVEGHKKGRPAWVALVDRPVRPRALRGTPLDEGRSATGEGCGATGVGVRG